MSKLYCPSSVSRHGGGTAGEDAPGAGTAPPGLPPSLSPPSLRPSLLPPTFLLPPSSLPPLCRLQPPASCFPPPASRLPPPASRRPPPAARLRPSRAALYAAVCGTRLAAAAGTGCRLDRLPARNESRPGHRPQMSGSDSAAPATVCSGGRQGCWEGG